MLGLAPDNRGLLPDSDVKRLQAFGTALRKRGENNLALQHLPASPEISAAADGDRNTFWSAPAGSHHGEIEVQFDHPVTFDHAIIMEWLNDGQHVQKYAIETWSEADGKWKVIVEAQAIGHEKIDSFPAATAKRVRLHILSSTEPAHIREFQLYNWSQPKPH